MSENVASNRMSNLFSDGVLVQFKKDGSEGFKVVTHLDHLKPPIDANIVDRFNSNGIYLGYDYGD